MAEIFTSIKQTIKEVFLLISYIPFLLINLIQVASYALCMLYLTGELSNLKKHPVSTFFSFIVMYSLTMIIQFYDDEWVIIGLFLILCIYFLFIYFYSSKSISQCLNVVICGYLIETLCQCFFILLYNLLQIPCSTAGYNDPASLSVVLFGAFLLIPVLHFLPVRKWMDSLENISYSSSLILILILIIISALSLRYDEIRLGLLMPTIASIAIFTFLGVLIIVQSLSDQRRKQAIRDYETYMPILNDMIENIQKQHHLYNNQIASLIHLADSYEDYDSLCHALKSYSSLEETISDNESYAFLHIENKLLASLLYCKYLEANNAGKQLVVRVNDYHYDSTCTDTEIVDMTGILIDNALEASAENDKIYVILGKPSSDSNKPFYISVENPGPLITVKFVHDLFTPHYTTKKNRAGHGLGLNLLKTFVDKYQGSITVGNNYYDNDDQTEKIRYIFFEIEI